MDRPYFEEKTYEKTDFTGNRLPSGEYEACNFLQCDLSNADLSGIHFSECKFTDCNFSNTKLSKTIFRDVIFKDCKMMGLHFEDCDDFILSFQFDHCILNFSSFYKMKLKKTLFRHCSLQETDLTEADCSGAFFDHCDFAKALFQGTNLEKADLRTSFNYSIDPSSNKIKKAKFSLAGIPGLLDRYDIIIG